MYKNGEKLIRFCQRKRGENYVATHEYTIPSSILKGDIDCAKHVQNLFNHMRHAFVLGVPEREKSSSTLGVTEGLEFEPHESEIIELCAAAQWAGKGKEQHPIVQNYFWYNDALTIGLEVPVWNDEVNGFIDILRVHPDGRIEIADFKPKAAKEKKAASQVARYKEMLCKNADISPEKVFCTWFDAQDGFILLDA